MCSGGGPSCKSVRLCVQVVAPVRETCAQTVGVIARCLTVEGVRGMVDVVLQLLGQQQWEVRHGGLLSLKYTLATRQVIDGHQTGNKCGHQTGNRLPPDR